MSTGELVERLLTLLSGQLGQYVMVDGTTLPACSAGEPPADIRTFTGLEVRVSPIPDIDSQTVHNTVGLLHEHEIRFVAHSPVTDIVTAVERVLYAFGINEKPVRIPAHIERGIPDQYVLNVRS